TIFSDDEWNLVIEKSPFVIQGSIIPDTVSTIVHNAARKQTINQDSYIIANKDPLCRSAAQIFNGLRQTLPMTSPVKTTEDEHCNKFLNVYINNVFTAQKRYEVKFNCSLLESMQRPDFLCTIDDVPFLISEIKPLGTSPLLKKNDFKKAHLRAKDAVNQQLNKKYGPGKVVLLINAGNSLKSFIMDQYNGMYRSWGYMTTKLATDIPGMPLVESNFEHFVGIEACLREAVKETIIKKKYSSKIHYLRVLGSKEDESDDESEAGSESGYDGDEEEREDSDDEDKLCEEATAEKLVDQVQPPIDKLTLRCLFFFFN
ncbi:2777_t:CDS:2, partial [Entrophospora sp. SA101]